MNEEYDNILNALRHSLSYWKPPENITPSEWADKYRQLSSPPAHAPGKYSSDEMPHVRGIMDAFVDDDISEIVVMASARGGKTTIMENLAGYSIHIDPKMILMVQPTLDKAEKFSRDHIETMIQSTPALKSRVLRSVGNTAGSTSLSKIFPGGRLTISGTKSEGDGRSITAQWVLMDEVSALDAEMGDRGSTLKVFQERLRGARIGAKFGLFSTPTDVETCLIYDRFKRTGKRHYLVKCPNCGELHEISHKNLRYNVKIEHGVGRIIDGEVKYECPQCSSLWNEYNRAKAINDGQWTNTKPISGRVGFTFSTLINKHVSMKIIAQEFEDCKTIDGNSWNYKSYKQFTNEVLGRPWIQPGSGKITVKDIVERCAEDASVGYWDHQVPIGTAYLVMTVDTQGNREKNDGWFSWQVTGIQTKQRMCVIERGEVRIDPRNPESWDTLKRVFNKERYDAFGNLFRCEIAFIDAGGDFPQEVASGCQKNQKWYAIRGITTSSNNIISQVKSGTIKDKYGGWLNINSQECKNIVLSTIPNTISNQGYQYISFSPYINKDHINEVLSEYKAYDRASGKMLWKPRGNNRTEGADLLIYAYAASRHFEHITNNRGKYSHSWLMNKADILEQRFFANKIDNIIEKYDWCTNNNYHEIHEEDLTDTNKEEIPQKVVDEKPKTMHIPNPFELMKQKNQNNTEFNKDNKNNAPNRHGATIKKMGGGTIFYNKK